MAGGIIENIISPNVAKEIKDLTAGLDAILVKIEAIGMSGARVGINVKAVTTVKELGDQTEKLNAIEKEALRLANEEQRITAQLITLQSDQAKRIAELNAQKKQLQEKNRLEAATNAQLVGAYKALLATQQQNKNALKDLAAAGDTTSIKYKELAAQVQTADARIKQIDKSVGEHQKNVGNYGSALDRVKGAWAGIAAAWTGAMAAGAGVIAFVKGAIEGAMADERAAKRLTYALDGNTAAMQRMMRFKDKMMKTTLFSEEEIMSAVNMGVEMGRTEQETKKMITAAMGLSRVTGTDLNTQMLALSGTYNGQIGRLGKLSTEVKGLTDEQLKNGEAVDILNKKYGNLAAEGMQSMEGQVLQAKKWWGEAMDEIGVKFINFAQGVQSGWRIISAVMGGGISEKGLAKQKAETTRKQQLSAHQETMDQINAQIDRTKEMLKINIAYQKYQDGKTEKTKNETKELEKLTKGSIQYIEQLKIIAALTGVDLIGGKGDISTLTPKESKGVTPKPGKRKIEKISLDTLTGVNPWSKNSEIGKDPDNSDLDAERQAWEARLQMTQQFVGEIQNLVNSMYANQFQKLDEAASADEAAKQKELDAAGNNQKKKDEIEAKYRLKEAAREKERKKAAHDQAVYNKAIAATQVIINTAVNAMKQGTLLGVLAYVALGAIELAAVLAQNIPSYRKGRKGGPAEFAKVHEGELIRYSDGAMRSTPAGETTTFLPKGADVIPANEVHQMAGRLATRPIGHRQTVVVNFKDEYGKEMLSEMKKKKTETRIIDMGNRIIYETGNYRHIASK